MSTRARRCERQSKTFALTFHPDGSGTPIIDNRRMRAACAAFGCFQLVLCVYERGREKEKEKRKKKEGRERERERERGGGSER